MSGCLAAIVASLVRTAVSGSGVPVPESSPLDPLVLALQETELEPALRLGFDVQGTIPKTGLAFTLGQRRFVLVDLNGDGAILQGEDGVLQGGHSFVVRLRAPFYCEAGSCEVRVDGTKTVTLTPAELGLDAGLVAEAAEVNAVRLRAGLPLMVLDPKLSRDCEKHCDFLERNGLEDAWKKGLVHFENPKLPGYTKEGERAGWGSSMHTGVTSYRNSVLCWSTTIWHAVDMLDPRSRRFGAALKHRVAMFYCPTDDRDALAAAVPHPPDGARLLARSFAGGGGEEPGPFAGDPRRGAGSGHPLIVLLPASWQSAKLVRFTLLDDRGHRIEGRSSSPTSPGQPKRMPTNSGCAVFVPSKPLSTNRTFRAQLDLEGHPPVAWSFFTGTR